MTATDPVQAVAEALRLHWTDAIMAECLCGWESPHGRTRRSHYCREHLAEVVVKVARPIIAAQAALTEAATITETLRGWADDDAAAGRAKSAHALRFAASMIEANALPVLRVRAALEADE